MQAFIYARFSTLEQAKGTSLARQLDDCRAFCDRKGWLWSPERQIIDEGRSAFDGANRAEGSCLAAFERDASAGLLPHDAVLVVERLDRISRQSAVEVFQLVSRLTDAGVAIATVDGERIYRRGSFDFASLIELIVKAQVSHEESEKKSQRVAAAWERKRQRAFAGDRKALTRRCPEWITTDAETGEHVLREDRARIVRRIFELAASGHGKHFIARTLNTEAVPTWRGGNGWHPSYVQKILVSRASVGELQLYRKQDGKRVPVGEPIQGYFPPVVDHAIFARVQADRAARTTMRGRRGSRISNLLSGIVKCGCCGSTMTFRNKGKLAERYLVCDGALRGRGCPHSMHFNYPALEAAIIDQTLHLALDDRHFNVSDQVATAESDLEAKRSELALLQTRQSRLVDLLSRVDSSEAERQLREIISAITACEAGIAYAERDLTKAKGTASPLDNLNRIRELSHAINAVDETISVPARGAVQHALRSLITRVVCDPVSQSVTVDLGTRSFSMNRAGGMLRPNEEIGLARLLELRERGWVLKKFADHPALGGVSRLPRVKEGEGAARTDVDPPPRRRPT